MAAVADAEQQLAWEARQRPRAGIAAIAAGLLTPISVLWLGLGLRDVPHVGLLSSLGQAFKPGPIGEQPSQLDSVFEFYSDKGATFIGASVVQALSLLALAWALTFLAAATRARRPELPRIIVYVGLVGAVLLAVAAVLGGIGRVIAFSDFLDSSRTVDAARDVGQQPVLATATLISELAPLALAAGILLIALNAMRVGLLTRFLGVLGMIVGGLTLVAQLFPFAPFVEAFWLVALGFVFLNFGPSSAPPAWRTGEALPWPSRRDMASAARKPAADPGPEAEPEPEAHPGPAGRPHPSSKKRKRKRRD